MNLLKTVNIFIWGMPMIVLLMATHIFFTQHTRFVQKHILYGIHLSLRGNAFSTLATTLAATLGTGNIIGMSTAVFFGGPGAVFWCLLTGIFGMATCYSECFLGMKYRDKKTLRGGPMYALKNGLSMRKTACLYAFFTILASFGVGTTTQSNALSFALSKGFNVPVILSGIICAILAGFIINGGLKSISKLCTYLVPFMTMFFLIGCITILIKCHSCIIPAIQNIIAGAFTKDAICFGTGGGLTGLMLSSRYGIARGLYTNEAGLGSTAIAAGSSLLSSCHEQGLISMSSVFWDTIVMCSITGLVIVTCAIKYPGYFLYSEAGNLMNSSFSILGTWGNILLTISIVLFAFATLTGWCFFGESALHFLNNELLHSQKSKQTSLYIFRAVYIVMIYIGCILNLEFVWEVCDLINALMVCPNVLCLFLLRKEIK